MKIGNIDLGPRPGNALLNGGCHRPLFQAYMQRVGADMVYTEFVSADALIRNISATTRKLHIDSRERPTAIQISGRETDPMVEAARIVEEAGPDLLDINFGCPVKKWPAKAPEPACCAISPKCEDYQSRSKAAKFPSR